MRIRFVELISSVICTSGARKVRRQHMSRRNKEEGTFLSLAMFKEDGNGKGCSLALSQISETKKLCFLFGSCGKLKQHLRTKDQSVHFTFSLQLCTLLFCHINSNW